MPSKRSIKYLRKKRTIRKRLECQRLEELLHETCMYLNDLIDDQKRTEEELRYCKGFICYKNQEEEFYDFRLNAHEEYEENMPFPYLTL